MTRKEQLAEMIVKVETGEGRDAMGYYAARLFDPGYAHAINAYEGSLDAAKALHESVLPGWWWAVGTCQVSDDACVSPEGTASVMKDGAAWADFTDVDMRPPGNPARAWLLAILRALHAQEPETP